MPECVKVSKEPKSGGIDFELENGYIYQCGSHWFKDQKNSEHWFRHLRDKTWFTPEVEEQVVNLVVFRPGEQRRD